MFALYILRWHFLLEKSELQVINCSVVLYFCVCVSCLGYRKSACHEIKSTGWVETKFTDFGGRRHAPVRRHGIWNWWAVSKKNHVTGQVREILSLLFLLIESFICCCCYHSFITEIYPMFKKQNKKPKDLLGDILKWKEVFQVSFYALNNWR